MLYNLRLAVAVFKCGVSPAPGGRWLVIFFGLDLSLKLQIELSGIHRS